MIPPVSGNNDRTMSPFFSLVEVAQRCSHCQIVEREESLLAMRLNFDINCQISQEMSI